jgi:hypothetical protein
MTVVMLGVIVLGVIMLGVIMLSVIMLSIIAPYEIYILSMTINEATDKLYRFVPHFKMFF